jgi:hypothetical protein
MLGVDQEGGFFREREIVVVVGCEHAIPVAVITIKVVVVGGEGRGAFGSSTVIERRLTTAESGGGRRRTEPSLTALLRAAVG